MLEAWRDSTARFLLTPERRNGNIIKNGIEPPTCRVHRHTLVASCATASQFEIYTTIYLNFKYTVIRSTNVL